MSIETWKAEFYPVPASEVAAEDALQHSLRKWIGLREENLSKHGVTKKEAHVGGIACALCKNYMVDSDPYSCGLCPIVKLHGLSCDNLGSPWWEWVEGYGPEPMIAVLQECIAVQEKEKA